MESATYVKKMKQHPSITIIHVVKVEKGLAVNVYAEYCAEDAIPH